MFVKIVTELKCKLLSSKRSLILNKHIISLWKYNHVKGSLLNVSFEEHPF